MISYLASEAVKQSDPTMWIWERCKEDFTTSFNFAHVDRWLRIKSADTNLQKAKKTAINNTDWCSDFSKKHKKEFSGYFEEYVSKKLCPKVGMKFVCASEDKKKSCSRIMGSITWELGQQCVDKPPCQQAGAMFQCGSLADYKACVNSIGDAGMCGVDVSA